MKMLVFVHEGKTFIYLLICPLSPRGGGGGLKALVDMSAKNVSFLDGSPKI